MNLEATAHPRSRSRVARLARIFALTSGFALAAWLVHGVGAARVLEILHAAWHELPLVVALETAFASCDALALWVLLGRPASPIGALVWIRATAIAYASSILLPAGKLAGEAARAAVLSGPAGARNAVLACSRLQVCGLLANAVVSVACIGVVGNLGRGVLRLALVGNAVACCLLAAVVSGLLRSKWLASRFGGRFSARESPTLFSRSRLLGAGALCTLGRVAQTAEYGVILLAVGGVLTPVSALVVQGIHLVGAAIGDFIPGQLGAVEGAYRAFASTLGFGADPARALSISLVARIAQIGLATLCLSAYALSLYPRSHAAEVP